MIKILVLQVLVRLLFTRSLGLILLTNTHMPTWKGFYCDYAVISLKCRSGLNWIIPSPPVNTVKMTQNPPSRIWFWLIALYIVTCSPCMHTHTHTMQSDWYCLQHAWCWLCISNSLMSSVILQNFLSVLFASSLYVSYSFIFSTCSSVFLSLPPPPPSSLLAFSLLFFSFLPYSWKSWEN